MSFNRTYPSDATGLHCINEHDRRRLLRRISIKTFIDATQSRSVTQCSHAWSHSPGLNRWYDSEHFIRVRWLLLPHFWQKFVVHRGNDNLAFIEKYIEIYMQERMLCPLATTTIQPFLCIFDLNLIVKYNSLSLVCQYVWALLNLVALDIYLNIYASKNDVADLIN